MTGKPETGMILKAAVLAGALCLAGAAMFSGAVETKAAEGQQVTVLEGGRQYPAMAEGIDGQGRLLIRTEEGTACLGFGEVSLRLHG